MRAQAAFYLALSFLLLDSAARADRGTSRKERSSSVQPRAVLSHDLDRHGHFNRVTRRIASYERAEAVERDAGLGGGQAAPGWSRTSLNARGDFVKRDLQFITDMAATDPVGAAQAVQQIPYLANNASGVTDTADQLVSGDSNEAQLPWNNATAFIATASTNISAAGGWTALPQQQGYDLNRSWEVVPGAVMPFYITSAGMYQRENVKRIVVTAPGKPRDTWLYANLAQNAAAVVYNNQSSGVTNGSVVIVSPAWLNEVDQQAGSVQGNELYWNGSAWEYGGNSVGPKLNHSLSTFEVLDYFLDSFFDTAQWPALSSVTLVGHSMGGQMVQRYATLKKQKQYDDNVYYFIGDPGSYTWLSKDRPYPNATCDAQAQQYHYGLYGNQTKVVKYARKDVVANTTYIVQRFLSRKIHMAYGLLDNGAGDTHCQAREQGGNHLDRGSQFVLSLANLTGTKTLPPTHSVSFLGNISHQDYAVYSSNSSLQFLFVNEFGNRYPDIVPYNPGEATNGTKAVPPKRPYDTHNNRLLAWSLFGGSIAFVICVFSILPFIFTDNWNEEDYKRDIARLAQVAQYPTGFSSFAKGVSKKHEPQSSDNSIGSRRGLLNHNASQHNLIY